MILNKFVCLFLFICTCTTGLAQKTFKEKKSFMYEVEWKNIQNNTSFKELVILKRVRGRANGGQKKITWMTYPSLCVNNAITDSIAMYFQDTTCLTQCEKNWDKLNKVTVVGTTGALESESSVWIHPPRIKYYKILEFVPFPTVYFDTNSYTTSVNLKRGWGIHEGVSVTSNYMFEKKTETVFEISALSSSTLGKGTLKATFEKGIGFTKMEYLIFDTYSITFTLSR